MSQTVSTTCRFVRSFVAAPDIVGLADDATFKYQRQGLGMVLDVEPISDVPTIAVDRQGFAGEPLDDHVRDQLLWEVIRAVVVRAVGKVGSS